MSLLYTSSVAVQRCRMQPTQVQFSTRGNICSLVHDNADYKKVEDLTLALSMQMCFHEQDIKLQRYYSILRQAYGKINQMRIELQAIRVYKMTLKEARCAVWI